MPPPLPPTTNKWLVNYPCDESKGGRETQMGKGNRRADGQRWSRRQCGAVEALLSQHGACRPAAQEPRLSSLLPLLLFSLSFFSSSISSPCLFRIAFSRLPNSAPFTCSIFSQLNYSWHCLPLLQCFLFSSSQTDSSWLLQRRKFSHVFLIKAPHRSPVVASHATLLKVLHLACNETGWWSRGGAWTSCRLTILSEHVEISSYMISLPYPIKCACVVHLISKMIFWSRDHSSAIALTFNKQENSSCSIYKEKDKNNWSHSLQLYQCTR